MKNKMKAINIAIAAYNAEANIVQLVRSLISQKVRGIHIDKIVVYSDKSSDNTAKVLASIRDKRLIVVDSKVRRGFGGAIEYILRNYRNELTIILNDDIVIKDKNFIQSIASSFNSGEVGLACVKMIPLPATNFIQHAQYSSRRSFHEMINKLNRKNSVFTIDGKCLAISRKFVDKIKFPKDKSQMGNVDSYLYFYCRESGFQYRYISSTQAYFVFPDSFQEFYKWTVRNSSNRWILHKRFGDVVSAEYSVPKSLLLIPMLKELFKNPTGILLIWIAVKLAVRKSKTMANSFNPLWETISSTKRLPV